jgi:hypothetical protein
MNNNLKSEDSDNYKYILIDYTDQNLMWNSAVSIIVFLILFFFIFMNWRPRCANTSIFEDMSGNFDLGSIQQSLGGFDDSSYLKRTI